MQGSLKGDEINTKGNVDMNIKDHLLLEAFYLLSYIGVKIALSP
jgi:hypothetical protein